MTSGEIAELARQVVEIEVKRIEQDHNLTPGYSRSDLQAVALRMGLEMDKRLSSRGWACTLTVDNGGPDLGKTDPITGKVVCRSCWNGHHHHCKRNISVTNDEYFDCQCLCEGWKYGKHPRDPQSGF